MLRNPRRVLNFALLGLTCGAPALAARIDLTTLGASGSLAGSVGGIAVFQQIDTQPTGSGVIDSFVRIQHNDTEEGYNTSGRPLHDWPDVNTSPTFTHDLQLADLPIVSVQGTDCYQFLLDINQHDNVPNNLLSMEGVQIFTGPVGSLTGDLASLGTVRWTMAAGDDVEMDYDLNSGSGSGDVFMNVPVSAFAGVSPADFVYLYSHFGASFATNDGYEEWAIIRTPEPASLGLLALGLLLFCRKLRD